MLQQIREKVFEGERITSEDAFHLMSEVELLDLVPLAKKLRFFHNPKMEATYVVDTNLNYTNICDAYCTFCAFYKTDRSDPSAYTYTVEQIMEKISRAKEDGITTVLMQGGLNDDIPFDYYLEMISETRKRFPDITPHFWSAPEIWKMADVSNLSLNEVLTNLWEAGQTSIPGGGSEVLSDDVKSKISPFHPKDKTDKWTQVHEEAHKIGFKTTATMMYGHIETDHDIVKTLTKIREIQDSALSNNNQGGFTAFIPWSYKRDNTSLGKKVTYEAGANRYLRMIAVSRIVLDNIPHIQASWFSEGKKTGQVALTFGADDFGGTLFDENVMLSAGFYNRTTENELRTMISESGFSPIQRLTNYESMPKKTSEDQSA